MTLKLIASDMDGTLLDNNDGLTKDNAKATQTDHGPRGRLLRGLGPRHFPVWPIFWTGMTSRSAPFSATAVSFTTVTMNAR